jgi:acid phosphatase family membrane protein YuiD
MVILSEYLFLIPLVVLFLSEVAKILVEYVKTGDWDEGIFKTGGMPSSHSAFVTSLIIIVYQKLGMQSVEFAMAFVFASVVWYDAMSVRKAVGMQAEILNKLQRKQMLKTRLGHSFVEVLAGIAFGAVVTQIGVWVSRF